MSGKIKTERTVIIANPPHYDIVRNSAGQLGIYNYCCDITSWHPMDVEKRFCGKCHSFHWTLDEPKQAKSDE